VLVLNNVLLFDLLEGEPLVELLYRVLEVAEAQYYSSDVIERARGRGLFEYHFDSFCHCLMNSNIAAAPTAVIWPILRVTPC
jgi:hypothetical protein